MPAANTLMVGLRSTRFARQRLHGLSSDMASEAAGQDAGSRPHPFGTLRSRSSSQAAALPSDGARQSPRGDSEPPATTFGPFGIAERLNWLNAKKRFRNPPSHFRMSARA